MERHHFKTMTGLYAHINRRYLFFLNWYRAMSEAERTSIIGMWVHERVIIFNGLLLQMDRSVGVMHSRSSGSNDKKKL